MLSLSPQVVHWYAENRDRWDHHKFSVLPTGVDDTGFKPENYPNASDLVPIHQRPLLVMVADRIRSGTGQWQARGDVSIVPHRYNYNIIIFFKYTY